MNIQLKIGHRIQSVREEKGLTLQDIANSIGVAKSTIQRYEKGKISQIKLPVLEAIAKCLGVNPSWLLHKSNTKNLDDLDDDTIKVPNKIQNIISSLPFFDIIPASAGGGQWLGEGHEYVFEDFENVPPDADFALRVRGDSMEPMYLDDDIVFVKSSVIVESGQVGVFFLNGEGYMKMLQGNRLVSLNREYEPVVVNESDSFFVAGRVVGK